MTSASEQRDRDPDPEPVRIRAARAHDGDHGPGTLTIACLLLVAWVTGSEATVGKAVWRLSGSNIPKYNDWDGSSFGTAATTANMGVQLRLVQAADARTRREVVVIAVGSTGTINAERWNGSSWSVVPISLGSVVSPFYWVCDVVYERSTDNAVMVWADGNDLEYSVWNGTSWAAPATVSDYATVSGGTAATQVALASKPSSSEIMLAVTDNLGKDYAFVWNGSSWSNAHTLATTTGGSNEASYVAYEQHGARAMVVYGKGANASAYYQTWDGASWATEASIAPPGGTGAQPQFIRLAGDPGSDRIVLGVLTAGRRQ
jgi:hypothetical protein